MTAPRVLPEYMGGDVGGKIAQAFQMRDQMNRQKDLDAVTTGVGLSPMTQDEAQNPAPSGFMHTVRGAIAGMQGKQNPDDVQYAQNTMAQHPLSVGVTPSTDQPDGFSNAQPKTPGAFNPLTGGFGPAIPRYAKLPSGQTIDMAYTPFGERLQSAMMNNQLNQTLLGIRGNQRMDQIGAMNQGREDVADTRGQYQVQTTGMRNDQSNTNNIRTTQTSAQNHATPSGSTIYSVQNRPAPATADPSAYVTRRMAALVKPQRDGLTGLTKPGLSPQAAAQQAQQEWGAAHGSAAPPQTPPPPRGSGRGDIYLGAPQGQTDPAAAAMAEHQQQASKYQQALKLGVDPKVALHAYATDVAATKKKYGIKD